MERLEKMKKLPELVGMLGFPESLLEYEKHSGQSFGSLFKFSRKDYDVFGNTFWMGKVNEIYYLGMKSKEGNHFMFFENKKMIQLYFHKEFEGSIEKNTNKDSNVENVKWKEEKKFWLQEIESFK